MRIKAISFNIRCANDENNNSILERAPRLACVITPYDADVIGLQEYTPEWEAPIFAHFSQSYEIFNQYRTDTGWIESAPILWKKEKFDCLKRGYFWLSDTPEIMSGGWDDLGHNRICLYALLQEKESGKTFVFMNTHLGFGEENQVKSVHLIQRYMESFSSFPTLLTGDFNMTPTSRAYAEMLKKATDVNAQTIHDRRSTFHAYQLEKDLNEHIDFCFVNEHVRPLDFKIIDELVDGKFPSDHYGIYADLELI